MTATPSNRRRALHLGTALATCIACAGTTHVAVAQELPGTATVVSGPAVVPAHTNTDPSLRIDLRNGNSVIEWNRFGIGADQSVNFVSTNGLGLVNTVTPLAVLNRVTGTAPSNIAGSLNSQGNIQVWLANPNGIMFGNGGSFNGGSLVLTTLVNNITTAFNRSNLPLPASAQISGTSGATITLDPGSTLTAGRDIVLVAQRISAGGATSSGQDTAMIAAQDVRFASGVGSPLSYTVAKGASLGGLRVLGTANISGDNVALVAGTVDDMVSNLLQVQNNAQITATDVGGTVYLTALTTDGAAEATSGSQITNAGRLVADGNAADVRIAGSGAVAAGGSMRAGGDVALTAGRALTVTGQVDAGLDYRAAGASVALGNGTTAVTQTADRSIGVQTTGGDITGASGLTLRLNTGGNAGTSRIVLDATDAGAVRFALGSSIIARGANTNSAFAPVGVRAATGSALELGNVTAQRLGDFDGTNVGDQLTGGADFTAGTIQSRSTFDADFTGDIQLASVSATGSQADVILSAGGTLDTTGRLAATRDVTLTSVGTATIAGEVDAAGDYAVTGGNVALGNGAANVQQVATGAATITTTAGGRISGAAGLTLRSNRNATAAANRLILDATNSGAIDFALGSMLAAGSTTAGATNSEIGVRFNRAGAGATLALGSVTGARLGDYTGGTTIAATLTGASDFTARTVTTDQAFNADFGGNIRVASLTTRNAAADVTLRAKGLISGSQATAPAISIDAGGGIALTAGTNVTMARVRGDSLSAAAGADFAPATRQNGAVTLLDGDVGGNLSLTAWGNGVGTGGQVLVGKAIAGGTLTLDNTAGTAGSLKVADSLQSAGLLTLRSAGDILVSRYAGSGTVGTVTSTGGAIDASAAGSVLAYDATADAALAPFAITQSGFGGISATGNLTVSSGTADIAIGTLEAGGSLTVNIDGNLYGRAQSTTAVPGALFKSQGSTTVSAGTTSGAINLARIDSAGDVSLTASQIAIGRLNGSGTATLTAPSARTYVGLQQYTGDAVVNLGGTFTDIGTVTTGNFYANGVNLSAGQTITATVTRAAQLGSVTADGSIAIRTGGVVASTVTSTGGSVGLVATSGTLSAGTVSASSTVSLTKEGGSLLAGDSLRFTQLTGGTGGSDGVSGTVLIRSSTDIRGNRIDALGGDVDLAAGFDPAIGAAVNAGEITGLSGGSMRITATDLADVAPGRSITAKSGGLGDYGALQAAGDIVIAAGTLSTVPNGAVRIASAQAGRDIQIANYNANDGLLGGIRFGSLTATRDIALIVNPGGAGDAVGASIAAGRDASVSARGIMADTISADRNVALLADTGRITNANDTGGIVLAAGGSIAAQAGLTMRVTTATASAGDVALQAAGVLTAGTITAGDDVTLNGSSVRLGSATSTGLGGDGTDVSFGSTTISHPIGVAGAVPTVSGAQQSTHVGGNVFVTASDGDVTGLAVDPLATPDLALVTTGSRLSSAYGATDLTAQGRSGSVRVSASGGAQLGTVRQGTATSGTGSGTIAVSAGAISADTITARTGSASLMVGTGTLVVGTVSAFDTASLVKAGASGAAGDEIRFTSVTGGAGESDASRLVAVGGESLGVNVQSASSVLGDTVVSRLGGVRVSADAGRIGGRGGSALAIDAGDAASLQNVTVRSATTIALGNVVARDRLSVIAGGTGSQAGAISLADARSRNGSIYLTAVNTSTGSARDVTYNTLTAPGEIVAITSGSNRGGVNRVATSSASFAVDAGTDVSIDARDLNLGGVRAQAGRIALNAAGAIAAGDLQAGTSVAGVAGGAIRTGSVTADAGDVALQAGGLLTATAATASDDVLLTGSSVRVGSVVTRGGNEVGDTDLLALTAVRDPSVDGVAGAVPAAVASGGVAGSSIVLTATAGDVTGLAIDPLDTPALATVTSGAQLSAAYGKASLTANDGGIIVNAAAGAAQLGGVLQQSSGDGSTVSPSSAIAITARAISADTIAANTGSLSLDASVGTLVIGSAFSSGDALLTKRGGDAGVDGDELRVTGSGVVARGGIEAISDTHVRAASLSGNGSVTVRALGGDVTGTKSGSTGLIALPTVVTGTQLSGAYGRLDVQAAASGASVVVAADGAAQLGAVGQGTAGGSGTGGVTLTAQAISADSIAANQGFVSVTGRSGTVVLGTVDAGLQIAVTKLGGVATTPGDEVRFDRLTAGTLGGSAGDVTVGSQTHVRGNRVEANGGGIFVTANTGDIAITDTASAQTSALFGAAGDVAIGTANATAGSLGILAGGNVSSGTALTAGEDLAIRGGGTVGLAAAQAGDDLTVDAVGSIAIDSAVLTGLGPDNTEVTFGTVPALGIGPATRPGRTFALNSTAGDVTLGTVTAAGPAASALTSISSAGDLVLARDSAIQGGLSIVAAGDITLGDGAARTQTATGLLSITSTNGAILQGSGRLTLGANSDGAGSEALTLNARTNVALGNADLAGGTARQSGIAITAGDGAIAIGSASGATFNAAAGTGFTAIGAIATGTAAAGADTTGSTVRITAANGDLAATTIDAAEAGHDVFLRASNAITLDRVTAGRSIDAAGASVTANTLAANGGVLTVASGGAIAVGNATSGAATTVRSGANTTVGTLTAGGPVSLGSQGGLTFTRVQSGGATDVTAASTARIDQLASGGPLTIKAGTDATLGVLTAGGDTVITAGGAVLQLTSLAAQGTLGVEAASSATLGSLRATGAAQLAARNGALSLTDLTSGGGATLTAATSASIGSVTASGPATVTATGPITGIALVSGGSVTVTSGGAVTLGRLSAAGAASVTAATSARIDQLGSGGATTIRAGTDATLGATTSAGDATITAKGTLALNGAFNAAGRAVSFTARDAAIGGDVTAATIRIVSDGAAGNKLVLGDDAEGTGFALNAAEIGRLRAANLLVLDAASGPVRQDLSIGSLSLAGPAKVLILADGTRIDVTGRIEVAGATSALQLGGSAENAGIASILRVVAKADGTGGGIAAPTAAVSLRAANIAFGQDAGFLAALGVDGTGTGDAAVARTFNDRASSTLYFAGANGGAPYTGGAAGVKLVTAGTLSLTYTDFALFQNTGLQGQTSGVDVATFLTVNANGTRPVLGIFGTLAGREGTAASVLGSLAFQINLNDVSSSRINGCVVGEGAGCITTVVFSPNLTPIDAVRPILFTVSTNYEVPFNPLIGTANDALFGDVGSIGLADIPLDPIECSDPASGSCPVASASPPQMGVPPAMPVAPPVPAAPANALPGPVQQGGGQAASSTLSQKEAQ